MAQVSKDMLIGELIRLDPNVAPILMPCWNALPGLSIRADGILSRSCYVHGLDVDVLVAQINDFLENK